MKRTPLAALAAAALAGAALAHGGVTDHQVMLRMEAMKQSKDAFKQLTAMAKGEAAFDAAQAVAAKSLLIQQLEQTPDLFRDRADDPKDEAKPAIWDNWDDFEKRARTAVTTARAMDVSTLEQLRDGVTRTGATCLDCHQTYREKK